MDLMTFYECVESAEDLHGIGIDEEHKTVSVSCDGINGALMLGLNAIALYDWHTLADVMRGKRDPRSLQHMTRVVGYYAMVENFNQSKVGELKDRHKGNYSVNGGDTGGEAANYTTEMYYAGEGI